MQQQANFARTLSTKIMQAGGDPKVADQWNDNATNASWRATQAQREYLAEQKNMVGQIASVAATAKDDATLNSAYQQIASVDPKMAQKIGVQLDRDPFTGNFVFGDNSQRTMKVLTASGRTAEQQANEALKVTAEQDRVAKETRMVADEARKSRETDADIALKQAHAGLYKAQTGQVGKPKAAANIESKPATGPQKNSAMDAITAQEDFKNTKFDSTLPAFAADVADRANKIRADAKRNGEDMGLDDARQQAIDELKSFVADRKVGETTIPLLGTKFGGEMRKTYTRGGTTKTAPAGGVPEIKDQAAYDALPSGASYVWNGKTLTKK
jgi:hypothetical protein